MIVDASACMLAMMDRRFGVWASTSMLALLVPLSSLSLYASESGYYSSLLLLLAPSVDRNLCFCLLPKVSGSPVLAILPSLLACTSW